MVLNTQGSSEAVPVAGFGDLPDGSGSSSCFCKELEAVMLQTLWFTTDAGQCPGQEALPPFQDHAAYVMTLRCLEHLPPRPVDSLQGSSRSSDAGLACKAQCFSAYNITLLLLLSHTARGHGSRLKAARLKAYSRRHQGSCTIGGRICCSVRRMELLPLRDSVRRRKSFQGLVISWRPWAMTTTTTLRKLPRPPKLRTLLLTWLLGSLAGGVPLLRISTDVPRPQTITGPPVRAGK